MRAWAVVAQAGPQERIELSDPEPVGSDVVVAVICQHQSKIRQSIRPTRPRSFRA